MLSLHFRRYYYSVYLFTYRKIYCSGFKVQYENIRVSITFIIITITNNFLKLKHYLALQSTVKYI